MGKIENDPLYNSQPELEEPSDVEELNFEDDDTGAIPPEVLDSLHEEEENGKYDSYEY